MAVIWYVTVVREGRAAPAREFSTKRRAQEFIRSLGSLSGISRTVCPGGRSYVVTPKRK